MCSSDLVVGCTRVDPVGSTDTCLNFDGLGTLNEGRAVTSAIVTLAGNAAGLPPAALTVFGPVNATGALTVYNTKPDGSGITIHASGPVTMGSIVLRSAPGTPAAGTVIDNDVALSPLAVAPFTAAERMFATVFKMRPETFRTQQAVVELTCPTGGCTASDVRTKLAANPGRPLWLTGSLSVDSAGDIGSATEPALLVVNGNVEFTTAGASVNIYGLVYTRSLTGWITSGAGGQINGAVVSEGGVSGSGSPTIVHDSAVLSRLRYAVGTFVRVPGSWRDFK